MSIKHACGDCVSYTPRCLFLIEDIKTMCFLGDTVSKPYYVLRALRNSDMTIYVPMDNEELTSKMLPRRRPKDSTKENA